MNIFVSSAAVKNKNITDIISLLGCNNIKNIELSGGTDYNPESFDTILEFKNKHDFNFLIHNYFPIPQDSFVLNLASFNEEIAEKSYNHIVNAINWCEKLSIDVYTFHAGFLIDPQIEELGNQINFKKPIERNNAINRFIERVNNIAQIAHEKQIEILIENNVLTKANFNTFNNNPLLMVDISETKYIMENTHDNVNLLLDVGHLKVSANTLNINVDEYFLELNNFIKAYHLSDNAGEIDSNNKVSENSWFWPYLKNGALFYSIELYNVSVNDLLNQIKLIKNYVG